MSRRGIVGLRALLMATSASLLIAGAAHAQASAPVALDIPASDLETALNRLAVATGQEIAFQSAIVQGKRAPAIRGALTADQALTQVLATSGLTVRRSERGALIVEPARPQGAAAADAEAQVSEVVVTGTNTVGGIVVGAKTTLVEADLERGGFVDIAQALRAVPGNFGGGISPSTFVANVGVDNGNRNVGGVSGVNLLGLGSGATLTLLNGRRLPVVGEGLSVDLGLVPMVAVERIDVVTDGASAIYGTDAVAGVVNVITRDEYRGVEVRGRYGAADGGVDTKIASVIAGGARGGLRGWAAAQYREVGELAAADRSRSAGMQRPFDIVAPTESTSYAASLTYDLSDRSEVWIDALYTQRIGEQKTTYSNISSFVNQKVQGQSLSFGAKSRVGDAWVLSGYGATSLTNTKVASRTTTPTFTYRDYRNRLDMVEVSATGELWRLPAGAISAAVGAAYREEGLDSRVNSRLNTSREVRSLYGEVTAPILKAVAWAEDVRITGAARVDDFSDVGTVVVPKAAVSWRPVSDVTLKASYSESFRAPSPYDLGRSYFAQIRNVRDAAGTATVLYLGGTGADVLPEESKNINLAVDLAPRAIKGLTLSLNYFDVRYEGRIANPDPTRLFQTDIRTAPISLIDRAVSAPKIAEVVAGATTLTAIGAPNDLTRVTAIVDTRNTNIASTMIDGVQTSAAYEVDMLGGQLGAKADVLWMLNFKDKVRSDAPEIQRAGTVFSPPEMRSRVALTWSRGERFTSAVFWNHVDDYQDTRQASGPVRVKAWNTFDASLGYRLGSGVRVNASVINLFDKAPPFVIAQGAASAANWDPTNADIVGRFASVELVKSW